jgi:hypothetical protein
MPAQIEACETVYCQTKPSSHQSIRDDPHVQPDGPIAGLECRTSRHALQRASRMQ